MNKKPQVSLDEVIKKFFKEKNAGTRDDLIGYITEFMEKNDVVDKHDNLLTEPARTTIYDYLKNDHYNKAMIKEDFSNGKPKTYFFMSGKEGTVKNYLLKKMERVELALKFVNYARNNDNLLTKEVIKELDINKKKYYSILKLLSSANVITPVGSMNTGVYEILNNDSEAVKDALWKTMIFRQ